ncbi:MAG TPA: hypothetical protein PL155_09400 [Candidatus Omnitrophota bacterium]|nr:hypothetical protein [Candidatus Omnitrophota bacterium]HPD85609.1 hypothetical protein [Candidatus Omnitrophota bacterium]HRZ04452.1 hypothetical protein [Candidatus Omnitrophota bacterium]
MCVSALDKVFIQDIFLKELLPLSVYVWYVYFSFCDGFGLHPLRKIVWGIYFLLFSYWSIQISGRFDIAFILGLSSLTAFVLAWFQARENKLKANM